MAETEKPRAKGGLICPLRNKDVSECCHVCPLWTHLRGKSPQGGDVDEWNCSLAWFPILLIENSQQQRQTGAAVESFRNEMVRQNMMVLEQNQRTLLGRP